MARFLLSAFFLIPLLLINNITLAKIAPVKPCINCHEDIYTEASSRPYIHSVVNDNCPVCHIIERPFDNIIKKLRFAVVGDDNILYLGTLPDDKNYVLETVVRDYSGNTSAPVMKDITADDTWEFQGKRSEIHRISDVEVSEIKKNAFIQATVSWTTDAYATTEIEYGTPGKHPSRALKYDIYSKKHRITLNTLRHKKKYSYRVISSDMNGNILRSDKYDLDTSKTPFRISQSRKKDPPLPDINLVRVFSAEDKEGFYMKAEVNKPSELIVTIKEKVEVKDTKHGLGLTPERYSKLEVCYKCHPHDASHPVGIRAEGPNLVTSADLPTIEDGIITCVTCHKPHGGEMPFYNRFDFRKDICIKCHIKGGSYIKQKSSL